VSWKHAASAQSRSTCASQRRASWWARLSTTACSRLSWRRASLADRAVLAVQLRLQPGQFECPNRHSSIVSLTRSVITAGSSSKANNTDRSKPCGPVMTTRTPPRNGSAAIQPSYCSLTCLPPASTAVSIRSRRVAGISLRVEDDQRVTHSRVKKIHSARTFAESEPRVSKRSAVPQPLG
jgi:hypothetical protein